MRVVSILGYVPSCLAIATVCGFAWRLRLGLTLILAVVFADAMTVAAKISFASPRPHAVDARVRTPHVLESDLSRMAAHAAVPADDFGFPSGHVATTAAWALGLAWFRRKSSAIGAAGTWVALMALSRMYLGRHFPADVVGGLFVGIAGLAMARLELPTSATGISTPPAGVRMALGVSLLAVVALAAFAGAGFGAYDAGRFCGLVGGVLLLMRTRALDDAVPPATRTARTAMALLLLCVALWSSTWTIVTGAGLVMDTMAVSAALYASVLLVPALAIGRHRS
jgi:hypothetical protein